MELNKESYDKAKEVILSIIQDSKYKTCDLRTEKQVTFANIRVIWGVNSSLKFNVKGRWQDINFLTDYDASEVYSLAAHRLEADEALTGNKRKNKTINYFLSNIREK